MRQLAQLAVTIRGVRSTRETGDTNRVPPRFAPPSSRRARNPSDMGPCNPIWQGCAPTVNVELTAQRDPCPRRVSLLGRPNVSRTVPGAPFGFACRLRHGRLAPDRRFRQLWLSPTRRPARGRDASASVDSRASPVDPAAPTVKLDGQGPEGNLSRRRRPARLPIVTTARPHLDPDKARHLINAYRKQQGPQAAERSIPADRSRQGALARSCQVGPHFPLRLGRLQSLGPREARRLQGQGWPPRTSAPARPAFNEVHEGLGGKPRAQQEPAAARCRPHGHRPRARPAHRVQNILDAVGRLLTLGRHNSLLPAGGQRPPVLADGRDGRRRWRCAPLARKTRSSRAGRAEVRHRRERAIRPAARSSSGSRRPSAVLRAGASWPTSRRQNYEPVPLFTIGRQPVESDALAGAAPCRLPHALAARTPTKSRPSLRRRGQPTGRQLARLSSPSFNSTAEGRSLVPLSMPRNKAQDGGRQPNIWVRGRTHVHTNTSLPSS